MSAERADASSASDDEKKQLKKIWKVGGRVSSSTSTSLKESKW